MTPIVKVTLWGTPVGTLGYEPGQFDVATFEYDPAFAASGVQVAPLVMPVPPRLHRFDAISRRTFKGVPGLLADSLPDRFGQSLIDVHFAEKGIPAERVTTLDRLLYVGHRGMGALEYEPSESFGREPNAGAALDLGALTELAALVQERAEGQRQRLLAAETRAQGLRLIRVGSSAGGARAKALVAELDGRFVDGTFDHGPLARYYLLKFDVPGNADRDGLDPPGMTRVESVYSDLGRELGLEVPHTDFVVDGEHFHFLIERFDRIARADRLDKVHYASWCGLDHADRDVTGAHAYEQLVQVARRLDLGQGAVTEIFRRAVFNVVGRNQDDHTKNFGFLMDRNGTWRLAPAFDLTFACDPKGLWTRAHQLRLNGKQDDFSWQDLLTFGRFCSLREPQTRRIVTATVEAFREFPRRAAERGVPRALAEHIAGAQRLRVGPSG